MQKFDAIIIGTGQAGPSLSARLAAAGMKVAIIERKLFGGTCVNTGCIPTKTLIASARAAYMARRAIDFGVVIDGEISVDMKRVKARKDDIVGRSNHQVPDWMKKTVNLTVFKGHARFISPRTVSLGDEILEADKIFINVGARAFVPSFPGLNEADYLTNAGMMQVDHLPEHLIIIGGSYIGLEFGQMYRRFGSRVTIVEKGPRLIARDDEDVSEAVKKILEDEEINIRLHAECMTVEKVRDTIRVKLDCEKGEKAVVGSHLLLAVGRVPNTDDLGLDKAGVDTDESGYIRVDDRLRTNVPGIWALGDCNGKGAFTHTSYNDFEIVAANLLEDDPRRVSERVPCYALYIDPPMGRAGMTEVEARRSGRRILIGKRLMANVGRAIEKGETQGFMKILVDADSSEILGAVILGVGGDEAIHSILDIMQAKQPYTLIRRTMHIHPTVSELIPTMLGDLRPLQ